MLEESFLNYGKSHRRRYHLPSDKKLNDLDRYIEIEMNKRSPTMRMKKEIDFFVQNLYDKQSLNIKPKRSEPRLKKTKRSKDSSCLDSVCSM